MPTGYTESIGRDCTFEEFVWLCTRGMGATIMMRDDGLDKPVPLRFEASDYHLKELQRGEAQLMQLRNLSETGIKALSESEFQRSVLDLVESNNRRKKLKSKYEAMLHKVLEWEPPSPNHVGLKQFMTEQIRSSLDFDCADYSEYKPVHISPKEWYSKKIASLQHDIEYHTKHHQEELDRTEERNRWLAQLRESVPQPEKKK